MGGGMATEEPSGGGPGRVPKALERTGQVPAVQELARLLWKLVKDSGLTLRKLEQAADMPYSRDTISRRLEGRRCPEDAFIEALLMQCAGGDRRRFAALLARVRPLVERARREERPEVKATRAREVVPVGRDSRAGLRERAEQAQQLAADLRERAVGYQRMCWWLLIWNRGLERTLEQVRCEREELQRAAGLDQRSLLRLADVRARILRQDADLIHVQAVLAEAEALRDDALSLAEAAAAGYRLLLERLGETAPPDDDEGPGSPEAMPPVPGTGPRVLAELRASLAAHRAVLRQLGQAVHTLVGPLPTVDPVDAVPARSDAVPLARATADRVVRGSGSGQLPTAAGASGGRQPITGQMLLVPAALVALVIVMVMLANAGSSGSASDAYRPTSANSPSSSPLAVVTAGSGEAALAGADQFGTNYSEPPPQPPDDVRMIAGPGCRTAMLSGDTGGTAALTAADAAGWRAGAFGCSSGYLVARASRQSDMPNLFTWTLTPHVTRPQLCRVSVAVPAETADSGFGAAGGHWAPAAVYDVSSPSDSAREPVVIDQPDYQDRQVVLAKGVFLGPGQNLTVRLSSEAAATDTYLWPEFIVASDLTLTCQAVASH